MRCGSVAREGFRESCDACRAIGRRRRRSAASSITWILASTAFFDRRARRFLAKHPDLWLRFAETLAQVAADPFQPSLRLYPLTGKLQGMQAVSLPCSYRIPLALQITEHKILLIDIGGHDEVYG